METAKDCTTDSEKGMNFSKVSGSDDDGPTTDITKKSTDAETEAPNEKLKIPDEALKTQIQDLFLFEKPKIKTPSEEPSAEKKTKQTQPVANQRLRLIFETDPTNTFLVTNPTAIFKFMRLDRFKSLSEDLQLHVVERLNEVLEKCTNNGHLLTEQLVTFNVARSNQETLNAYRKGGLYKHGSSEKTYPASSSQDLVFQLIHIGIRFVGKSDVKTKVAETILQIVHKICAGKRYLKCHLELIYQYLKCKVTKLLKTATHKFAGYDKLWYSTRLLQAIIEKKLEKGPQSYFYFSGYLSGILLNSDSVQYWPFEKSFATCMWFRLSELQASIQDPQNLPVLFNCGSNGFGGFECYFNENKLFYRILPPSNYSPPTTESNGILISELTPGKWTFFGIEHDKPFLARAQLIAVVNDKQVVNFPMDYPQFNSNSRLSMVSVCQNFVGQMTSFMLFKQKINNPLKFVQIYKAFEYGVGKHHLTKLNPEIFDQKLTEKLLLLYTPHRTLSKMVYDCVDMNDGELLINCGVWHYNSKSLLAEQGGLLSLLPLLEQISQVIHLQAKRVPHKNGANLVEKPVMESQTSSDSARELKSESANLVNSFIKLVITTVGGQSDLRSASFTNFNRVFLHTLTSLPNSNPEVQAVNCQTVQLLSELRFLIDDQQAQEDFLLNLMNTSDFWISTNNTEVVNDFWSFVKAIYSQHPVHYNAVFPIRNLIDFMLKISDRVKNEGAFCCRYHKRTFAMFYTGGEEDFEILDAQTEALIRQITVKKRSGAVYEIDKLLEPIAGVLESVFTKEGDEILDQIQYIAKSLTVKSVPCFQMQMLTLLKVLLLDTKSQSDCASPIDVAARFLNAKGLQVLLYLCSNASFDVKAMCIKLIDVLSLQTSLIQMRIDTDLITYLSHVILPEQMTQTYNNQKTGKLQFIKSDEEPTSNDFIEMIEEKDDFGFKDLEDSAASPPKRPHSEFFAQGFENKKTGAQVFSFGLANCGNDEKAELSDKEDSESAKIQALPAPKFTSKDISKKNMFDFGDADADKSAKSDEHLDELGQDFEKPAFLKDRQTKFSATQKNPFSFMKGGKKPLNLTVEDNDSLDVQFGNFMPPTREQHLAKYGDTLVDDFHDEDTTEPVEKAKPCFTQEPRKKFALSEDFEFKSPGSQNDNEPPKPTQDVLMSRNLRGGARKFAFECNDSSEESQQSDNDKEESSIDANKLGFGQKYRVQKLKLPDFENQVFAQLKPKNLKVVKGTGPRNLFLESIDAGDSDNQASQKCDEDGDVEGEEHEEKADELESEQEQQLQPKKQDRHGTGTTGDTNDQFFDEPCSSQQSSAQKKAIVRPKFLKNAKKGLNLNIDAINELFTFGGEKGDFKEETQNANLENDIRELAAICVKAMRCPQKRKTSFQKLIHSDDEDSGGIESLFMVSQPVKGIKIILEEEKKKAGEEGFLKAKPRGLSLTHILEEGSPTSTSCLSKPGTVTLVNHLFAQVADDESLNLGGMERAFLNNTDCQAQLTNRVPDLKKQIETDEYTQELENLYTSCLEWILSRAPSCLNKNLIIDDYDKINFQPALKVLMTLVSHSNNMVRQRALQDMFMLAQWDSQNGLAILQHPNLHIWLLELLMPYQDLACSHSVLSESSRAVFDMGSKLHTLLLKNTCINPEEEGFKKVNLLTRWPAIIQERTSSAAKNLGKRDFETANSLTRVLLANLISSLQDECEGAKSLTNPALRSLVHIALQVEELILSSHFKPIDQQTKVAEPQGNESILRWVQRDYLLKSSGSADKQLWPEWDLIEALMQAFDSMFFPDDLNGGGNSAFAIEQHVISALQNRDAEQFSEDVDILMFEGGSGQQTNQQSQSRISMFPRLLHTNDSSSGKFVSNFAKSFMNILCIAITQADTKQLTQLWLERLERFVKHLFIVSEVWSHKNEGHYFTVQKKLAEIVSFALAFLFHEMHLTGTPTAQQGRDSPKASEVHHRQMFQQTLKNLFIFFVNIVHYSADLETDCGTASKKPASLLPASRLIMQGILVKQYASSKEKIECLITEREIQGHKESNFEDFPECFHQNDWKVTFFHNSIISSIVKGQLNLQLLEAFAQRRKQYAQRIEEADSKTEKAKDEILKKIQSETLEAVSTLSEVEFDRKNTNALLIDNFQRERLIEKKNYRKEVCQGMWRDELDQKFQTTIFQFTGESTRCLLKDRPTNGFLYIDDPVTEKKVFLEIVVPEKRFDLLESADPVEAGFNTRRSVPDAGSDLENSDHGEFDECSDEESQTARLTHFAHFSQRLCCRQKKELQHRSFSLVKEHFLNTRKPRRKELFESKCELLNAFRKREGFLFMTNYELVFIFDIGKVPATKPSSIFFFDWVLEDDKGLYKVVDLSSIQEVQRRRFLGQHNALELFCTNNQQLLINLPDSETRNEFSKRILRQRKNKCKNLKYYTSLDPKWILKKKNLTDDWVHWRISNFDYLMQLNQLAGRSYLDLSQYPVFPWILANYSTEEAPAIHAVAVVPRGGAPPGNFRDLTKNLQLLGSAERQAEFLRKYEDFDGRDGFNDRFHCGSHYSNPTIVLHYLSRLHPYLEANVEVHGGSTDSPDRVFFSLEKSFRNALHDFSDVRELAPEFYFLPEMYKNSNKINFGARQDGSKVQDVVLPPWAKGDSFKFVQVLREAFESPYVSANLHSWIDYIFGCKQRDQEAEQSLNTFSKLTYQADLPGDFDISTVDEPDLRAAYESQLHNYGQTPFQLFKAGERHPPKANPQRAARTNVVNIDTKLKVFKPVQSAPVQTRPSKQQQQPLPPLINPDAILKCRFVDEQRIVGVTKDGYAQHFLWQPRAHDLNPTTPFSLGVQKKQAFDGREKEFGLDQIDRSQKRFDFPMLILHNGNYVAKGGFWDGKIGFCDVEGADVPAFELTGHSSTVTALAVDKQEKTLISGSKAGEVIVWRNCIYDSVLEAHQISSTNPWMIFKTLNHHEREISSLFVSSQMGLFASASYDGTANLYNLWSAKFLRTFKHPSLAPIYSVQLAQTPLAVCTFFSREDHLWFAYAINGTLLSGSQESSNHPETGAIQNPLFEECSHVISPLIVKDTYNMEKLVYGTERGYIVFRHLPSLVRWRRLVVSSGFPVLTMLVSQDRRFLLVGCGNGGLIVITERGLTQTEQQASQPSTTRDSIRASTDTLEERRAKDPKSKQGGILNTLSNFMGRGSGQGSKDQ